EDREGEQVTRRPSGGSGEQRGSGEGELRSGEQRQKHADARRAIRRLFPRREEKSSRQGGHREREVEAEGKEPASRAEEDRRRDRDRRRQRRPRGRKEASREALEEEELE